MAIAYVNRGVASAAGGITNITPALPASIVSGNLLLAMCRSSNNNVHNYPAGWTKITQIYNSVFETYSWGYRLANGADTAPNISWTSAVGGAAQVVQFTGNHDAFPISGVSAVATVTSATHTVGAITTTYDGSAAIYLDINTDSTTLTTPGGYTVGFSDNAAGVTFSTGFKIIAPAGTSGAISTTGGAAGSAMLHLEVIALGSGPPIAESDKTLPSIVAYSDDGARSAATLSNIVAFMFDENNSRVILPSIIANTVITPPPVAVSDATLPSIIASTSAVIVVPDVGAASFLAMTAAANDDTFGTGTVSFAPMTAMATERALPSFVALTAAGNDNKHATGASAFAPLTAAGYGLGDIAFAALSAVGSDEGIGIGSAAFAPLVAAAFERGVIAFAPMSAMACEPGLISFAALLALASDVGDTYPGWIINYETGAPSRYEGLRANSFCQINGITYIANEDGIYAFGADDDAGVPINAEIMLPTTDYDSAKNKRIPDVWLGLRSTREMRLKVITNNADVQYYSVEPTDGVMEAVRVKLGLGVEGRYWQFGLTNLDGQDFELESMGFSPIELKRHGR